MDIQIDDIVELLRDLTYYHTKGNKYKVVHLYCDYQSYFAYIENYQVDGKWVNKTFMGTWVVIQDIKKVIPNQVEIKFR